MAETQGSETSCDETLRVLLCFLVRSVLALPVHNISPYYTDPVPLYSMYSKLQNVNIGFPDGRLGPTLSCLVAEKS